MPDVHSLGLGGGSRIHIRAATEDSPELVTVGPEYVLSKQDVERQFTMKKFYRVPASYRGACIWWIYDDHDGHRGRGSTFPCNWSAVECPWR